MRARAARFRRAAFFVWAPVLCAAAVVGAGCVEERVVGGRVPFADIPGAETNIELPEDRRRGSVVGIDAPQVNPVQVAEDGEVTYTPRNGGDLLRVILHALANDHREEFAEQVLGEMTRQEYLDRGLDPAGAFDTLKERERDIRALVARMPNGELTPGARIKTVDRNVLRVWPQAQRGLAWNFMDMEFERGVYRLRWFGRQ